MGAPAYALLLDGVSAIELRVFTTGVVDLELDVAWRAHLPWRLRISRTG
jgi:hypothetical protein